jgi:hypothetical protein
MPVNGTPQSAMICERWPMQLSAPNGEDSEPWFIDWVLRQKGQASKHVTAGFHAYRSLLGMEFTTASELFGGMGCQSLIIHHLFHPAVHYVQDSHPGACAHLEQLGIPGLGVHNADSLTGAPLAELIGLDFGDLTIHRAKTDYKPTLDIVFAAQPKAVVLTDIAGARLHLQKDRYEALMPFADCSTYAGYLQGLGTYLESTYGYGIRVCCYHNWSAVMSLVPSPGNTIIHPVPARPVGITLEGTR